MMWTRPLVSILLAACTIATPRLALGGAVILGGDDLGDHGKIDSGENKLGWLYIQRAVDNILNIPGNVTRPGNDGSIAALGSSDSNDTVDNPGAAIASAASELSKTINFHDGVTAINKFFDDLEAGSVNPAMIWIAGSQDDDQGNDVDANEGTALLNHAADIAAFVNSGGGLMSHGCDDLPCSDVYTWLPAVIPTISFVEECDSDGAMLTPAGQAAFPGLMNSDIDDTAGPCHNHFTGNFGSLSVLALDGDGLPFIIGGGAGTRLAPAGAAAPTLDAWAVLALTLGLFTLARRRLRARG